MPIEQVVCDRINELVGEAETLRQGNQHGNARSKDQAQQCVGWTAAALNIVQRVIADPQSSYRRTAETIAARDWGFAVNQGVGEMAQLLLNLLRDAQRGLISSIADTARAEVFDNFLDHAKAYLDEGQPKQAGVIAGVVFEDALRRICHKHSIEEQRVKLDKLITDLTAANILSPAKAKRARAAAHVRTQATHAQWNEFDLKDVQATIEFAEELILNHIDG